MYFPLQLTHCLSATGTESADSINNVTGCKSELISSLRPLSSRINNCGISLGFVELNRFQRFAHNSCSDKGRQTSPIWLLKTCDQTKNPLVKLLVSNSINPSFSSCSKTPVYFFHCFSACARKFLIGSLWVDSPSIV